MSFENPMTFVRSLKGAPASVMLALLFARHPMANRELQRWTGYSDSAIAQAARLLTDLGWISALGPRGPWALPSGRQLPLMQPPDAPLPDSISLPVMQSRTPPVNPEGIPVDREPAYEDAEDENFVRTLHALYDAGIGEPTAGRLARLPHVSAEYVARHVEQANAQGFHLGIAIYRIEHAWPLPERKETLTVEERIRRFLDGG